MNFDWLRLRMSEASQNSQLSDLDSLTLLKDKPSGPPAGDPRRSGILGQLGGRHNRVPRGAQKGLGDDSANEAERDYSEGDTAAQAKTLRVGHGLPS